MVLAKLQKTARSERENLPAEEDEGSESQVEVEVKRAKNPKKDKTTAKQTIPHAVPGSISELSFVIL